VDLVLTGGRVFTSDAALTVAEAVAVRDGRIAWVGPAAEAAARVGPGTRVFELEGRTVLPGFQVSLAFPSSSVRPEDRSCPVSTSIAWMTDPRNGVPSFRLIRRGKIIGSIITCLPTTASASLPMAPRNTRRYLPGSRAGGLVGSESCPDQLQVLQAFRAEEEGIRSGVGELGQLVEEQDAVMSQCWGMSPEAHGPQTASPRGSLLRG